MTKYLGRDAAPAQHGCAGAARPGARVKRPAGAQRDNRGSLDDGSIPAYRPPMVAANPSRSSGVCENRIAVGRRRIGAKGGAGVGSNELPPPGGVPKRACPRGVGSKDAFGMTLPQCQFDDSLAEPGRTLSVSGLPMAQGLTG
ncbi:hypothetical protein [Burkholderia glumae]|uniref:hypothetical protein n=1 Tax=Burkholderia glumae TaxID=337 RepID=UPI0012FDDA0B|nr:hypothetical protein [Burkholderia glumae]QHE12531.1 hypothetical protein GQR88_19390 [Burkholderia glumae AU6208]